MNQGADFAVKNGYIHEAALAYETIAELAVESGLISIAADYMSRCIDSYKEWGATKKIERLLKEHGSWYSYEKYYDGKVGQQPHDQLDFETFRSVISKLAHETKHESLISQVMTSSVTFTGAENGYVILRDVASLSFNIVRSFEEGTLYINNIPISNSDKLCEGVINYVLRTGKPIVVDDALIPNRTIPGLERDPYISENLIRSLVCIPIFVGHDSGSELIGVIYLENNMMSAVFSNHKVKMLELIGQTASGRIELSKKSETLEESLHQASQVQQAMLPRTGRISSFTVSEYYQSAEMTGGDWYGYYEDHEAQRLYFFIGDVTGHGVSSSLVTGTAAGAVYATIETLRRVGERPDLATEIEVLAKSVNQAVFDTGAKVNRMMTMLFMVFDTSSGSGFISTLDILVGVSSVQAKRNLLKPPGGLLALSKPLNFKFINLA